MRLSRRAIPYLLLLPGIGWLFLFYVYPALQLFLVSLWTGNITDGYNQTFNFGIYADAETDLSDKVLAKIDGGWLCIHAENFHVLTSITAEVQATGRNDLAAAARVPGRPWCTPSGPEQRAAAATATGTPSCLRSC